LNINFGGDQAWTDDIIEAMFSKEERAEQLEKEL
jgi:hypothetical protein